MSLIALVGLPNSGKSSLFNSLTKSKQRVANFPGITVEKRMGEFSFQDEKVDIVDLPGIYTLDVSTLDEKVTRDYIFEKIKDEKADIFTLVVDATNLKKSLYLALQLKEIGQPFVMAMNMMDQAQERGLKLDLEKLSEALGGVKIVPTVAVKNEGTSNLVQTIIEESKKQNHAAIDLPKHFQRQIKESDYIKEKFATIEKILSDVTIEKIQADSFTEKLDSIVLHPLLGPFILLAILVTMFQLLFTWSDPFMGMIEGGFESLAGLIDGLLTDGLFKSLLIDGVIAGVGGILVFLPHIVFLFVIIYFLEDFGYLGRVAFLLDFTMRKLGLPGKAVVPLLSSHACAIPGIMSARIIENHFQRMTTMMVAPLTACSARLPVYTLIIGIIIPNEQVLGFLGLPGLVLFALYTFGIASAFIISFIAKKSMTPTSPSYLLMELPPYRIPKMTTVLKNSLLKGWIFVKKAGTVILVLSVIIWGLVTFPKAPADADKPAIHYSYAASIGKTFEPIFTPLGFDWKITTALIPSFGAREVLVSAMGTVYAVDGDDTENEGFLKNLSSIMSSQYSLATLLALLVWFIFSPQCISTIAVLKKETNGYKMPLVYVVYSFALAYIFALVTFLIFS